MTEHEAYVPQHTISRFYSLATDLAENTGQCQLPDGLRFDGDVVRPLVARYNNQLSPDYVGQITSGLGSAAVLCAQFEGTSMTARVTLGDTPGPDAQRMSVSVQRVPYGFSSVGVRIYSPDRARSAITAIDIPNRESLSDIPTINTSKPLSGGRVGATYLFGALKIIHEANRVMDRLVCQDDH